MSTMVSFKTSIAGRKAIKKIVARAAAIVEKQGRTVDRRGLEMDLAACHANGNRLRLDDLAKADDFNLLHDVKRSEEHTSELQSLMRISYAVFCLKKKT